MGRLERALFQSPTPSRRQLLQGFGIGAAGLAGAALVGCKPDNSPTEAASSEGFERFRSLNYPYQVDYPQGWTAQSTQLGNMKVDIFKGEILGDFQTNINIISEPVNSWVTIDDYTKNYIAQLKPIVPDVMNVKEIRTMMKRSENGYHDAENFGTSLYTMYGEDEPVRRTISLSNAKVGGQKIEIIAANPKNPSNLITALFLHKGQGWQITLSFNWPDSAEYIADTLDKFQKMLESIRFR